MATGASGDGKPSLLSTLPKQLPADFLKEITNGFHADRKLGQGAFGTVYMVCVARLKRSPFFLKKIEFNKSMPITVSERSN
jgi:hypothetical protein